MQDLDTLESVCGRLDSVLNRLASAYRSLPESKLGGRLPDGRTRAVAGHELAALIAATAQGIEDCAQPSAPEWRPLPYEGPFVVGDQLGVTGHDLLVACERMGTTNCAGADGDDGDRADGGSADGDGIASVSPSAAVWAPPPFRCERAGVGSVLTRVLTAAEELAANLY